MAEEILTSIKGFTFASSFDLNMGYPSIPLDEEAQSIFTIIMPFRAYEWDASQHGEESLLSNVVRIFGFELNRMGYKPLP